ncbi:MAG: octaprenyl-diphosphate synthase [Chthoniobacter sp.]|jgi:octaprenyl-diphosphate synthase|nr:octaprenyl-diphosphate synthase [Chthoniobacter sp.]
MANGKSQMAKAADVPICHLPSAFATAIDFGSSHFTLRPVKPVSQLASTPDKTAALKATFELINSQLYSVEERIRQQARAFDPAVEGYIAYAIESHGKRLRPALALLAGGATGNIGPSHFDLAVVVELIHAATLVHDDILDGADKRRGQPTANAKWGNAISVLLGDCLFAHALKLSTSFQNGEVGRRIAHAASEVCSGEIIQTQRRFDLKLSVPDYYKIIEMKTAALFAVACELGAFINEASPDVISALRIFGLRLGTAYQIYDDVVDLAGDEVKAGKTLGSDLRKGKLTLPILHLLQTSSDAERQHYSEIILNGGEADILALADLALASGAIKSAVTTGRKMLREAASNLALVPDNRYREALSGLVTTLDEMLAQFCA